MNNIKSLIFIFCGLLAFTISAHADSIVVRVNGLYCNYCAATTSQVIKRKVPGVSSVRIWLKSGIIVVTGKGNSTPSASAIRGVLRNSTFRVMGVYRCAKPNAQLKGCKKA